MHYVPSNYTVVYLIDNVSHNITKDTSFIATFCIYCNNLVIVLKYKQTLHNPQV